MTYLISATKGATTKTTIRTRPQAALWIARRFLNEGHIVSVATPDNEIHDLVTFERLVANGEIRDGGDQD